MSLAHSRPRGERFDLRDLRGERLQIDDTVSPLVALKAQLKADPPEALFRVELLSGDGTPPDRIRTVALDDYDGALFTTAGDYRRAGHHLAADPNGGASGGTRVRQRISVLGLDGPFLPAAGRAVAVDAGRDADIGFDAASGTLVTDRARLSGLTYVVTSTVVAPSDEALAAAEPSTDPALLNLATPTPRLPIDLANLAATWSAGAPSRGAEVLALRDHLRQIRYDDTRDAEPGHSYAALERVLFGDEAEREGYAEQFAAAYVVLARARGIPARVATGYLLPGADADGVITVTEADAHAWPEVNLDGLGWVPIEATGDRLTTPPEPDQVEQPPGQPDNQPNDAAQPSPPVPPSIVEPEIEADHGAGGRAFATTAAVGSSLAILLLLGVAAAPPAAKAVRRRRRRHAVGTSARVVGAWRETLDRLVELGMPVATALTASEVAERADERFPGRTAAVAGLVPLLGEAVCAPHEPDPTAADEAWHLAGVAQSDLRRGAGLARRLGAAFDPRPLHATRRRSASAAVSQPEPLPAGPAAPLLRARRIPRRQPRPGVRSRPGPRSARSGRSRPSEPAELR